MTNQTNHTDETNSADETYETDENNMDNEESESIGIIVQILCVLVVASIFIFGSGLLSCSNNHADNHALFSVEGVTVMRYGEIVAVQWYLANNNRRISVDEAIRLGFEKNEDGHFAIPLSHITTSSRWHIWSLQKVVRGQINNYIVEFN